MNGMETISKLLVVVGGVLILLGGMLWLLSKVSFLGHLPGDIRIERPGFTCLIPLSSSIIISIGLTILLNVVIQIVRLLIRRGHQ
ncbi:MAG: DUF2905 domain-containing protein [Chloroflexota bacterium]|nr:DUF2905 domain-containing protein [Chloroflexota bacterium]